MKIGVSFQIYPIKFAIPFSKLLSNNTLTISIYIHLYIYIRFSFSSETTHKSRQIEND